ncbi:MAG TPA: carbonic anhydrase [Vicinamibacterales bacterium]|nr:carbonic anhydrase [Vicinamibacterales bacterium]
MPKPFVSSVPYIGERIFAAAVYCSDGRIGDQVDDFLHHGLGLPRYDRLACPGGPVVLSGRSAAYWDSRGVEEQLRFLAQVHDVRTVVLIAHEGCAYYLHRLAIAPHNAQAEQRDDLQRAVMAVNRVVPRANVLRFFARRSGHEVSFEAI